MCNYHVPVCVSCQVSMKPEKNGVDFVETMSGNVPYKIWSTDKWKCPKCGISCLVGFGNKAFAEHFDKERFEDILGKVKMDPHTVIEDSDWWRS